ncbi:MAG: hypothetical protein AB1673_09550 [Actinomycetota bacterium]
MEAPPSHGDHSDHGDHEEPSGAAGATVPLDDDRRRGLGLPPLGTSADGSQLPPLGADEWLVAQVVAARFLMVQTNFSVAEEPDAVTARRALYTSRRLAEDLAMAGAGGTAGAAVDDLRASGTQFFGEVVGLVIVDKSRVTATVAASVRRWSVSTEGSGPARLSFYVLRLVLDEEAERWAVVDVEVT